MRPECLTVVRFRYAHEHDNAPLAAWLRRLTYLGATVRDSCFTPRVDLTRNMEVGRWLEEDRTQHLLMLDSDMVPVDETAASFTAIAPTVLPVPPTAPGPWPPARRIAAVRMR